LACVKGGILMGKRKLRIGDKQVIAIEPYYEKSSELVGREEELRNILAAWMNGSIPLLIGEPGLGKTRLAFEAALRFGRDLYNDRGSENNDGEELVCRFRESDKPDKKIDYILWHLGAAMKLGGVYFLDEAGKLGPAGLHKLGSVLDSGRYVDSTLLAERINARPGFRMIMATNKADLERLRYDQDWFLSRMNPIVEIRYPSREEINRIAITHYSKSRESIERLLDQFWNLWRGRHGDQPPTPRATIQIFGQAIGLAIFEEEVKKGYPIKIERSNGPVTIKEKHLDASLERFFKGWEVIHGIPTPHF